VESGRDDFGGNKMTRQVSEDESTRKEGQHWLTALDCNAMKARQTSSLGVFRCLVFEATIFVPMHCAEWIRA